MPTGTLPEKGKKLWEQIYNDSLSSDCDKECAARKAWAGVKNAGWSKDKEGQWHKKADISSFSLAVKRASQDPNTGEMRWRADTSDVGDDLANDNMTLELFSDFVSRINENQLAPEVFRSEFWQGGMPYLSISHYTDHGGKAVPGMPTAIYVDGAFLKAKGILYDTPLGKACWKALKSDLSTDNADPIQISIGFIDWAHIHKDTGYNYIRESVDDFCPECLKSIIKGQSPGNRSFVKGQLVHLALTRVPMNQRTNMTVEEGDMDMTTRVEDAESIVGSELAQALETEAKSINKAELVIKSDAEKLESLFAELATLRSEIAALKEEAACGDKKHADAAMEDTEDEEEMKKKSEVEILRAAFVESLSPMFAEINQRLDLVATAIADKSRVEKTVPDRRSMTSVPTTPANVGAVSNKLHDVVRRSVGLG